MIKIAKKILPLAVLAASVSPASYAAEESQLTGELRTFYFNRDFAGGGTERVSLTQAVILDYVSPSVGMFTFGASFHGNLKLDGHGDEQSIGTLDEDGDGYAKIGQLYADAQLAENTKLRIGRWVTDTKLLNDNDSRATPPSTQAIKLESSFSDVNVYGMYSDRANGKTGTSFTEYTDANGDDYGILILGVNTALENGLNLAFEYGDADDFAEVLYFGASYTTESDVLIDFHHYMADYGNAHTNTAIQNQDSSLSNMAIQFPLTPALKMTASYQVVGGDVGYSYGWGGEDDNYLLTWNAVQYSDFNRLDEESFQLRLDYTTPIEGLRGMIRHVNGEFKSGGVDQDHKETNIDVRYAVQGLEGLNLRARYARVRLDTAGEDIDEVRLYANYSF